MARNLAMPLRQLGFGVLMAASSLAAIALPQVDASDFQAAVETRAARANRIADRLNAVSGGMDAAILINLRQALLGASEEGLKAASGAKSVREALNAVRDAKNQAKALVSNAQPNNQVKSLGSLSEELVFYPIVPCRLLDTRQGAGTRLAIYTPYGVDFDGGNPGNAAGCTYAGVVSSLGGTFAGLGRTALAINLTVTQSLAAGWIVARPVGSSNASSNQNFSAGQDVANMAIVQDAGTINEFELMSSAPTHAIVDVLGVFAPPMATPLDCVMVDGANTVVPAGSTATNAYPGSCAAGYTEVAKYCRTGSWATNLAGFNGPDFNGACNWRNPTGADITVNTDIRCCRVPGR